MNIAGSSTSCTGNSATATTATTATNLGTGTIGGSSGGYFGGSTYTKVSTATTGGNISFDNGSTDTPGLHFYYGNNTNFGIDVATSVLRFVANLDETGGSIAASLSTAGVFSATSFIASSDERLKTNWVGLDLDFVARLSEVKHGTYERISSGNREVGVSAQALQKVIPTAVIEGEDGTLAVNYGAAALVAAIELAKVVEELRAEIELLKARI